jgi:hypothetical protein
MLFGLINIPTDFQYFINDILIFLDVFFIAYIDDILIYSNSLAEYKNYIQYVLKVLKKFELYLKFEKYKFYQTEAGYLGILIRINRV